MNRFLRFYLTPCALTLMLLGLASTALADPDGTSRSSIAIAGLQIIHNAPDAGPLDVYANGTRLLDDFDFRTATPFEVILSGTYTFDVVAGMDSSNANPIFSTDLSLVSNTAYVMVAQGLTNPEAGEPAFELAMIEGALLGAVGENVEVAVIHGAPDLGMLDIRLLDPVDNNNAFDLLANNIDFGDIIFYKTLTPIGYNIEASDPDNIVQYEVFRIELQAFRGASLVLALSGRGTTHAEGLEAMYIATDGTVFLAPVITLDESAEAAPAAFALHSNAPNPFHTTTAIRLDLPAAAAVRVELYDLHGRRVLTMPTRSLAAGAARRVPVDAAHLASGVYLYRVFAETAVQSHTGVGRMVLVR